jgi:hypothetical protein
MCRHYCQAASLRRPPSKRSVCLEAAYPFFPAGVNGSFGKLPVLLDLLVLPVREPVAFVCARFLPPSVDVYRRPSKSSYEVPSPVGSTGLIHERAQEDSVANGGTRTGENHFPCARCATITLSAGPFPTFRRTQRPSSDSSTKTSTGFRARTAARWLSTKLRTSETKAMATETAEMKIAGLTANRGDLRLNRPQLPHASPGGATLRAES